MSAIFAFVSTYAYFQLYCIKARDHKYNANSENCDKLPYAFGDEECGNEEPGDQCG